MWNRPYKFIPAVAILLVGCDGQTRESPEFVHNAGVIFSGRTKKLTHNFSVSNTTSKEVRVLKVEKTCACTDFNLENYVIAPYSATRLSMSTNMPQEHAKLSVGCRLITGEAPTDFREYSMVFEAVPDIESSSMQVNFGLLDIAKTEHPSTELTVSTFNSHEHNGQLKIESDPGVGVTTKFIHGYKIAEDVWKNTYKITVALKETNLANAISNGRAIRIGTDNGAELTLPVVWKVLPNAQATPSILDYHNVPSNIRRIEIPLEIQARNGDSFRIIGVTSKLTGSAVLEFDFDDMKRGIHGTDATLIIPPDFSGDRIIGVVTVTTDLAAGAAVRIPVSAKIGK